MSGWNSWGIRRKLFSIVLFVLVCNIVVLLFMGSTLFELFYMNNKQHVLRTSAQQIRTVYNKLQESQTLDKEQLFSNQEFFETVNSIEDENALLSLISLLEDGTLDIFYHSRSMQQEDLKKQKKGHPQQEQPPIDFIQSKLAREQQKLLARIQQTDYSCNIQVGDKHGDPWENSISLSAQLDDNLYLYIQTPRDYLKSTADLAVRYTAFLSIVILCAGSVIIYYLVGRITRPVQEIQKVAEKIAQMDFSTRCFVNGGDEIAILATSINHMSDELQSNIDTLVRANEVLQTDLVRQQQTDQMRKQFVANVSHDFKTPLTLIISYAEALLTETQSAEEQEYCGIIISEGNRLSRMVNRLLDLSKLESGVEQMQISIFCISEVLDAIIKNYQILTEKRQIAVKKQLSDEFIVCADYLKIQRVVSNLLENAIKYTPDGSEITLSVYQTGANCRVEIENVGTHIEEQDLKCLFDSFYRADKSRTRADGYGLGLAIVKVVMEAHQQPYGVENTEKGVRFWFELSLAEMEDT